MENIVNVEVDSQNVNKNHTSTGYIPYYNKDLFGEIGYKVYANLQEIVEEGFIENGYIYNIAKRIFSADSRIKFIVIGDTGRYLGDIVDTK